jgi:hypothetical protein
MSLNTMTSSSSLQQVSLPCSRSNSFLDHKRRRSNRSSSTTTRKRGRRSFLLLRVCVHPPLHFTHQQQLLQYTALLPRAHGIETEVALRDHGNCNFFLCCSSLSLCRGLCLLPSSSSHSTCGWFICRKILT